MFFFLYSDLVHTAHIVIETYLDLKCVPFTWPIGMGARLNGIYNLIDDMKKLMGGLLAPNLKEEITGNVEVREIFKISKIGNVAGCYVKEGFIKRDSKMFERKENKYCSLRIHLIKYHNEFG